MGGWAEDFGEHASDGNVSLAINDTFKAGRSPAAMYALGSNPVTAAPYWAFYGATAGETEIKDLVTFGGATRQRHAREKEAEQKKLEQQRHDEMMGLYTQQLEEQREYQDYMRSLYEEQRQRGLRAQRNLENYRGPTMAEVEAQPDFMFGLKTGQNAIETGAAARKNLLGGRTQKGLMEFGTDYGHTKWQNAYDREYNRLLALAGMGERATSGEAAGEYGVQGLLANNVQARGNVTGSYYDSMSTQLANRPTSNVDPMTMAYYNMILKNGTQAAGAVAPYML